MRGTSGRDAKICRPLSRSTASAPDPAPAGRICAAERAAGRAGARGARGGGQEERGRGEQHGDEAERPSHRAVESRQPAGRGEVAVAFRLPSRDSRLDGQTAGPAPIARRDVRAARAGAGARGADVAGRRAARRRPRPPTGARPRRDRRRRQLDRRLDRQHQTDGEVRAAYRPRGGPWGAETSTVELEPRLRCPAARRRGQPNGEFVAVWVAEQRRRHRAALRGAPPARAAAGAADTFATAPAAGIDGAAGERGRERDRRSLDTGDGFGLDTPSRRRRRWRSAPTECRAGEPVQAARGGGRRQRGRGRHGSLQRAAVHRRPATARPADLGRPGDGGDHRRRERVVDGVAVTANPGASYTAVWAVASQTREASRLRAMCSARSPAAGEAGAGAAVPDSSPTSRATCPAAAGLRRHRHGRGRRAARAPGRQGGDDRRRAARRRRRRLGPDRDGRRGTRHARRPSAPSPRAACPSRRGARVRATARIANGSHRDGAAAWHPVELARRLGQDGSPA